MIGIVSLFKSILEMSIFASVMIVFFMIFKMFVKDRIHIKIKSFIWTLIFLRLCIPGMLESPLSISEVIPNLSNEQVNVQIAQDVGDIFEGNDNFGSDLIQHLSNSQFGVHNQIGVENDGRQNQSDIGEFAALQKDISPWILGLITWIIGCAIVLLLTLSKEIMFRIQLNHYAHPITNQDILDIVARNKQKVYMHRKIKISTCAFIHIPMVVGLFLPHILLPEIMLEEFKREHIETILLHEICHIKRNDIFKQSLCLLVKTFHWFNPLVWIAAKSLKEDIEFACDHDVLKLIKPDQGVIYCESLLLTTRFIGKRKVPQLSSLLLDNGSILKERIKIMLQPKRKPVSIVVLCSIIVLSLFVLCFTTACQPTPESEIVINKGSGKSNQTDSSFAKNSYQITWDDELETDSLKIKLNIDRNIPVNNVWTCLASKSELSEDSIAKIIEVFANGNDVRQSNQKLSEQEIEERIIQLKMDLSKKAASPNSIDVSVEELEAEIKGYEKLLLQSSNEAQTSEVTPGIASYRIDLGNNTYAMLDIAPNQITYYTGDRLYPSLDPQTKLSTSVDIDKAKELANNMVNQLGFADFKYQVSEVGCLVGYDESRTSTTTGYILYYTRDLNGMPFAHDRIVATTAEDAFAEPIYYEKIIFYVDNSGLIGFELFGLLDLKPTENQVSLLGAEEIKTMLLSQLKSKYIWNENSQIISVSIDVNDMKLALMQSKIPNNTSQYIVIPVWKFYGQITYVFEKSNEPIIYDYTVDSIITLDAQKGSIIDTKQGY